jgi:hypothetical protein
MLGRRQCVDLDEVLESDEVLRVGGVERKSVGGGYRSDHEVGDPASAGAPGIEHCRPDQTVDACSGRVVGGSRELSDGDCADDHQIRQGLRGRSMMMLVSSGPRLAVCSATAERVELVEGGLRFAEPFARHARSVAEGGYHVVPRYCHPSSQGHESGDGGAVSGHRVRLATLDPTHDRCRVVA